jgi:hypothetical protein
VRCAVLQVTGTRLAPAVMTGAAGRAAGDYVQEWLRGRLGARMPLVLLLSAEIYIITLQFAGHCIDACTFSRGHCKAWCKGT